MPLGATSMGLQRVSASRGHASLRPLAKAAPTEPQARPQPRYDDRKSGGQRSQGWRPNPNRIQPRGNFAPRTHQTQPDVDDAEDVEASTEYVDGDVEESDEVINHQTEIPDERYDDADAWMQYDANAITFEHEDDYQGYWPAPTSHQVRITDQVATMDAEEWCDTD
ncbi:hypothetical protein H4R20_005458 [Coemansia guatemalensis]|uniref:Uncharacterized protein n=1 Tax=Coemansia guatemalensis TaxID=2761395 RepID=A0A9W8HVL8_9FUNG|nr:hypothetical protein H4R20_005458 [Coemansia guatemalensis]